MKGTDMPRIFALILRTYWLRAEARGFLLITTPVAPAEAAAIFDVLSLELSLLV
jgi:hypothetical protein